MGSLNGRDNDGGLAAPQALVSGPAVPRRSFLRLSGVGLVAALASNGFLTGCTDEQLTQFLDRIRNRPVRKDVASLGPEDPVLVTYGEAVAAMKALDSSDPTNPHGWRNQAEIHQNRCPHGNWLFLPWHRAYLWYFEEICRELTGDDGFALPYWDWTSNPTIPAPFTNPSSPLFNGTRTAGASSADSTFVGSVTIDNILQEPNFLNFASGSIPLAADQRQSSSYDPLEGTPHNYIHGFVGGDMGSFMSPLDPLFWLHHNRIEQLWVDWNITRGNPNTNDGDWTNRRYTDFVDRQKQPVNVTTTELTLMPLLSYRFDTQVP